MSRRRRRRALRGDDSGTASEDVQLILVVLRLDVPQRTLVHGVARRVTLRSSEGAVRLLSQAQQNRLQIISERAQQDT